MNGQSTSGRRVGTAFATLASLTLHGGAAAALLHAWTGNDLGAVVIQTDAISIEIVASSVTEQAEVAVTSEASGADASVAATAGAETDSLPAEATAEPVIEETAPVEPPITEAKVASMDPAITEPDVDNVVAGSAETDDNASPLSKLEKKQPDKKLEKPASRPEPLRERERAERDAKERKSAESSTKGGVTSKTSAASKSGVGRLSASTGDVLGYAARVRARVASNKPPGGGRQGTAVVSFGVTGSGGLSYVRLSRSSGNAGLDQAAVAAVRRAAPFPPPPSGASGRQLSFAVPFHFR